MEALMSGGANNVLVGGIPTHVTIHDRMST
jgi:hypothetical protein